MASTIPGATGDPLAAPALTDRVWESIRAGHRLVHIGEDRVLDWTPDGRYRLWTLNRSPGGTDPLGGPVCQGQWGSINGDHDLVYLGQNRVLDRDRSRQRFRVWLVDRAATGAMDPLGTGAPQSDGAFTDIRAADEIAAFGSGLALVWTPSTGDARLFRHDAAAVGAATPLPGPPVAAARLLAPGSGHRLVPVGNNRLLDWDPATGAYRVLIYDPANQANPFGGDPETSGTWVSIRTGHELTYLDGDCLLDRQPSTGQYRLWRYDRDITTLRQAQVRYRITVVQEPRGVTVPQMVAAAWALYASYGFELIHLGTDTASADDRVKHNVLRIDECRRGQPTSDLNDIHTQLRSRSAAPTDIAVFIVAQLEPRTNGCSAHPAGLPGCVIEASGITEYTLAHELGHVLGLNHVRDRNMLLDERGTFGLEHLPPDFSRSQLDQMLASPLVRR